MRKPRYPPHFHKLRQSHQTVTSSLRIHLRKTGVDLLQSNRSNRGVSDDMSTCEYLSAIVILEGFVSQDNTSRLEKLESSLEDSPMCLQHQVFYLLLFLVRRRISSSCLS